MDFIESIKNFCIENFNETNNWYNWKINESKIPVGIKLPLGNQYLRNISLKEQLHGSWKIESNESERGKIIKYYITVWGGIKTNDASVLEKYMTYPADSLINFGEKGIASWSKALVIHDPAKYAIFDARVSNSLNCLQIIYDIKEKKLFPLLSSRNKTIKEGNEIIRSKAKVDNWSKIDKLKLYNYYLNLLENVAQTANSNISTVEMLLFAKSEDLVGKIKFLLNGSIPPSQTFSKEISHADLL